MGILDAFRPSDPELVEKTLSRLTEQDQWNDVFSTKLIEILDKVDQLKAEIRQRLRRADERIQKAESVTQAESFLLDEAAKAEELKNKLADAEQALRAVHAEFNTAKKKYDDAQALRSEARAIAADVEQGLRSAESLLQQAIAGHESAIEIATSATESYKDSLEKLRDATSASTTAANRLDSAKDKFEGASQHLDAAELIQKKATALALEARHAAEEGALKCKEATGRYELARTHAERASRLSHAVVRYAVLAVALSWTAMGWTGWLMARSILAFWLVFILTIAIGVGSVYVLKETAE